MSSYAKYSPAGSAGSGGTVTAVTADAPLNSTGGTTPDISLSGVVAVAHGGTNSSAALSNNRVIISSGGAIVEEAAITASRALASDTNGLPTASSTTATELGFISGVTSSIQTQLNGKQSTLTLGNLTDAGTDGITVTGGTGAVVGSGTSLSQHVADSTHNGYLSSTDWVSFKASSAQQQSVTASGASTSIDLSVAAGVKLTLNANTTVTFSNPTTGGAYSIEVVQDTSTRTVAWTNVKWPSGAAPVISAANGAIDRIALYYDGSVYLGTFAQAYA